MIDLHCHILPGLDDGPQTIDESLAIAEAAVAGGTRTVVATPHVNSRYELDPRRIPPAVEELRAALRDRGIGLEVLAGAEIAQSRLDTLDRATLRSLRLGAGPYLLIECPLSPPPRDFESEVLELLKSGERVLLAHPERSPLFMQKRARLQRLVRAGALSSVTAASMTGRFGDTVRHFTLGLLADGLVHDVSSDAHDARHRSPALLEGFRHAEADLPGILEQAEWFTAIAPAAILAGERPSARPKPPRRRPRRGRRLRLLGRSG